MNCEDVYVSKIETAKATVGYPKTPRSKGIMNERRIFDLLQFSDEDFDTRGNRSYEDERKEIQMRGEFPYYKPVGWHRFGLNIDIYNKKDGDKEWIDKYNPNAWAVMYHGVRNPTKRVN